MKRECVETKRLKVIGFSNLSGVASVGLIILGVVAIIETGLPDQNMSVKPAESVIDVQALLELKIQDSGLTSITLYWSQSPDSAEIADYRIYMGTTLLDTVDGSVRTYTVTRLRTGSWYQFHVDACNSMGKCSDGGPVAGGSTLTVQQATEAIIDKITNLVSTGTLTAEQGDPLIKNLAAIYQLDRDNIGTTTQLQAFIDNVNSLISQGILSQEVGQSLIAAADDIIRNIF